MGGFVTQGGMDTGLALVRLFTERWGAEVTEYDASPSGEVVINLKVATDSSGLLVDRAKALVRKNREHIERVLDQIDAVNLSVHRRSSPLP